MKIRPVGAELFLVDEQTDMKLTVFFVILRMRLKPMGDYCTEDLVRTPQRMHSVTITKAAGNSGIRKQMLLAVTNYTIQIR